MIVLLHAIGAGIVLSILMMILRWRIKQ